jgi:hypothetical protein
VAQAEAIPISGPTDFLDGIARSIQRDCSFEVGIPHRQPDLRVDDPPGRSAGRENLVTLLCGVTTLARYLRLSRTPALRANRQRIVQSGRSIFRHHTVHFKDGESRHLLRENCRFSGPRRATAGHVESSFCGWSWSFILLEEPENHGFRGVQADHG